MSSVQPSNQQQASTVAVDKFFGQLDNSKQLLSDLSVAASPSRGREIAGVVANLAKDSVLKPASEAVIKLTTKAMNATLAAIMAPVNAAKAELARNDLLRSSPGTLDPMISKVHEFITPVVDSHSSLNSISRTSKDVGADLINVLDKSKITASLFQLLEGAWGKIGEVKSALGQDLSKLTPESIKALPRQFFIENTSSLKAVSEAKLAMSHCVQIVEVFQPLIDSVRAEFTGHKHSKGLIECVQDKAQKLLDRTAREIHLAIEEGRPLAGVLKSAKSAAGNVLMNARAAHAAHETVYSEKAALAAVVDQLNGAAPKATIDNSIESKVIEIRISPEMAKSLQAYIAKQTDKAHKKFSQEKDSDLKTAAGKEFIEVSEHVRAKVQAIAKTMAFSHNLIERDGDAHVELGAVDRAFTPDVMKGEDVEKGKAALTVALGRFNNELSSIMKDAVFSLSGEELERKIDKFLDSVKTASKDLSIIVDEVAHAAPINDWNQIESDTFSLLMEPFRNKSSFSLTERVHMKKVELERAELEKAAASQDTDTRKERQVKINLKWIGAAFSSVKQLFRGGAKPAAEAMAEQSENQSLPA